MGYVSPVQFERILNVPVALPQTEIRRSKTLEIVTIDLKSGQSFEVKSLTVHLLNILTSEVPHLKNTDLGYVSVNISNSPMICSGGSVIRVRNPGAVTLNPYLNRVYSAPGIYTVSVTNNIDNADITVVVSGVLKMHI